jgi:hypothetical protein
MTDGDPSKKAQRLSMTLPEADYLPRSMQDAGVRERRRAMLGLDHITELCGHCPTSYYQCGHQSRHRKFFGCDYDRRNIPNDPYFYPWDNENTPIVDHSE